MTMFRVMVLSLGSCATLHRGFHPVNPCILIPADFTPTCVGMCMPAEGQLRESSHSATSFIVQAQSAPVLSQLTGGLAALLPIPRHGYVKEAACNCTTVHVLATPVASYIAWRICVASVRTAKLKGLSAPYGHHLKRCCSWLFSLQTLTRTCLTLIAWPGKTSTSTPALLWHSRKWRAFHVEDQTFGCLLLLC
jgi:hypothetical protein